MPPVDVVRGRRGDAVSGSDAVVRYREGYFSGPDARLDVVAAAFVPDRVQIFFGRGLLLSQPVAGRGGLSEVLARPRRIWPAEKCGSPPTVSQPACVHLDRPARSGERAGQNVGRRLGDFGCAQPAPEDDAGRRIVTAGRTAELGAPPRCRRRCPRWETTLRALPAQAGIAECGQLVEQGDGLAEVVVRAVVVLGVVGLGAVE